MKQITVSQLRHRLADGVQDDKFKAYDHVGLKVNTDNGRVTNVDLLVCTAPNEFVLLYRWDLFDEGKDIPLELAARDFMYVPENWEHFEEMKSSISTSLPAEFMALGHAVEDIYGPPTGDDDES